MGRFDAFPIVGKLEGRQFSDAVMKSSYPIDIHDAKGTGSIIKKPKTGVFYIPYRSMNWMVAPSVKDLCERQLPKK